MISTGQVEVEILAGQQDSYVRRVHIVELESDPENPTQWLIEFSGFDTIEEIQPPPLP